MARFEAYSYIKITDRKCDPVFTVGRRNWLFSDSPKSADANSMVYTMVEMAKAHNLNIYKYLNYLLEQLPRTAMADEELSKLVPWNRTVQATCSGAM